MTAHDSPRSSGWLNGESKLRPCKQVSADEFALDVRDTGHTRLCGLTDKLLGVFAHGGAGDCADTYIDVACQLAGIV